MGVRKSGMLVEGTATDNHPPEPILMAGSTQGTGEAQRRHLMGVSHNHTALRSLDGPGLRVGTRSASSWNNGLSEAWCKGRRGGWGQTKNL